MEINKKNNNTNNINANIIRSNNSAKLFNLTNSQKNIWNTEIFFKGSNINNICGTIYLDEPLNFSDLQATMKEIINQNDNFHIRLTIQDGKIMQYFDNSTSLGNSADLKNSVNLENYSNLANSNNRDFSIVDVNTKEDLQKLKNQITSYVFNVLNSPLFKIKIFRFPDQTGGVIVNVHHIISDSWTLGLIAKNIANIYSKIHGLNNSNTPIPQNSSALEKSSSHSYINYIKDEGIYISGPKFEKNKVFWQKYLDQTPDLITIPSFKEDYSENQAKKSSNLTQIKANRKIFELGQNLVKKINAFCTSHNLSIYHFLMSIYSIYIGKINNSEDFILGTPILNRTTPAQKMTMGMFINTIPVRVKPKNDITFLAYIEEIKKGFMSIYRHQKYAYEYILEDLRKNNVDIPNLYKVLLSYQITRTITSQNDMNYSCDWSFSGSLADDMDIHFFDFNDSGALNIAYDYKLSKYSEDDISKMHNRILYLIEQILLNPVISIKELSITPKNELNEILKLVEALKCNYPKNMTINELFEEQAKATPNNIAIKYKNLEMTYKELDEKSNQLAHFLRNLGIKANDVIGLRLNKSLEIVIGILGIIKSGACYLPIDLSYPQERVSFMLKDSSAKIFLTNSLHKDDLEINIPKYLLDINFMDGNVNPIYDKSVNSTEPIEFINTPDDLIYIIYTSGSTGTPKGVMLKHRNVVRLLKNDKFQFDFTSNDVWTMFHSVAFDFSVWELYGALLYGGKLILIPEDTAKDPAKFLQLMRDEKVTVLNQTPTYFYNLLDRELLNKDSNLKVRYIIFGGEALKPTLAKPWKDKYPFTKLINMYGITETTVHVTFKELSDTDLLSNNSNIGKPIPTLKVYILDQFNHLLPFGVEGEMCVSGLGVAKGYLNRPELNMKKFIPNPYNPEEILYRSADSAYLTPDGDLHYLGRIDKQVKIRGFRVEIGEIESKLLKHPLVKKCVVLSKKDDLDNYLVAYIVLNNALSEKNDKSQAKDSNTFSLDKNMQISKNLNSEKMFNSKISSEISSPEISSEIRQYISGLVPTYMVPSHFVFLDTLPLTSNGKVDGKKLLAMNIKSKKKVKYEAPRNNFEKTFIDVLENILEEKNIGINDDILNLGADSLTLMKITVALLEKNYIVNIQDIYEQKTVKNISDMYKSAHSKGISGRNSEEISDKDSEEGSKGITQGLSKRSAKGFSKEITQEFLKGLSKDKISEKSNTPTKNIYWNFNEDFNKSNLKDIKNILLTGSTGFLGIHLLNALLKNTNAHIYCLIRDKDDSTPTQRLKDKWNFYFKKSLDASIGEFDKDVTTLNISHLNNSKFNCDGNFKKSPRITAIHADITKPGLGLSSELYNKLGKDIDLVIHSAAFVKHYGNSELFEKVNVTGTKNIIEFCQKFNIYMNHISTTSVSAYLPKALSKKSQNGNMNQLEDQHLYFDEHALYIGQNYSDNIYIKTKFEAEYAIWKALQASNLKASIYRLGNISARYSDGKFQQNSKQNAFLLRILSMSKLGKIAKSFANFEMDLSPVDYCANIITKLALLNSSYSKVFHIYNNHSIKFIDLINKFKMLKSHKDSKASNNNTGLKIVSDEEFYNYVKSVNLSDDILGIINDLTSNTANYNSNIKISNKFTIDYMKKDQLSWPDITDEYIQKFFSQFM